MCNYCFPSISHCISISYKCVHVAFKTCNFTVSGDKLIGFPDMLKIAIRSLIVLALRGGEVSLRLESGLPGTALLSSGRRQWCCVAVQDFPFKKTGSFHVNFLELELPCKKADYLWKKLPGKAWEYLKKMRGSAEPPLPADSSRVVSMGVKASWRLLVTCVIRYGSHSHMKALSTQTVQMGMCCKNKIHIGFQKIYEKTPLLFYIDSMFK